MCRKTKMALDGWQWVEILLAKNWICQYMTTYSQLIFKITDKIVGLTGDKLKYSSIFRYPVNLLKVLCWTLFFVILSLCLLLLFLIAGNSVLKYVSIYDFKITWYLILILCSVISNYFMKKFRLGFLTKFY